MRIRPFALSLVLSALLAGCGQKAADPAPASAAVETNGPAAASTNIQSFLVRGVVKKIDAPEKTITIQHEAIPKYMPAMTMPFNVKDLKELEGVQAGDTVWFRLWVAADESWIDRLKKEDAPAGATPQTNIPPEREAVRVVRDVEPLKVGDPMTDYQFTNELGQAVSLSQYKGQALAFTFIFTRCPLPDFCPRMTRNFLEVCQKLSARQDAPTNWHLLTISFDPHYDTPEILRSYAQAYGADSKRWNFVTGAMADIDAITDQFELTIVKRGNDWEHKMRTVVVDAAGRVQQIIYGNTWKPDALVEEIIKAAKVQDTATAKPASAGEG